MENKNSRQGLFKITSGVMIGVVALLGYLFMGARNETFQLQKSLTTKVEELSYTRLKLDSILTTLDGKMAEIVRLGGNITELQLVKAKVEEDRDRLQADLNFSVSKYQYKIREYEGFLTHNDENIAQLKKENAELLALNDSLKAERERILDENEGLKFEKESLNSRVREYQAQNNDLRRKVSMASAMKAVSVQITALSSRGKERSGGSYRGSRIDRIKVSFILASNPLAAKNLKDIYVRILSANGSVIIGRSGSFWYQGRELGYSTQQSVLFENNDQKVNIVYDKGSAYEPGSYTVELYAEGFRIGNGKFDVN